MDIGAAVKSAEEKYARISAINKRTKRLYFFHQITFGLYKPNLNPLLVEAQRLQGEMQAIQIQVLHYKEQLEAETEGSG